MYVSKSLHGQFFRRTEQDRDECSWEWLRKGKLKKETEGLLHRTTEVLRTYSIKNKIDKQDVSPACRMCGEREETVECTMLAQKYLQGLGA